MVQHTAVSEPSAKSSDTSSWRGSTLEKLAPSSVPVTRSFASLAFPCRGTMRTRVTLNVPVSVQQSGSALSISPSPSSSTQLLQISLPLVVVVVVVTGVLVVLTLVVVVVTVVVVAAGVTSVVTLLVFWSGFGSGIGLEMVAVLVTVPRCSDHRVGDGDGDLRPRAQAAQVAGEAAGARVAHDGRGQPRRCRIGHDHVGRGGRPEIARHQGVGDGRRRTWRWPVPSSRSRDWPGA